MNDPLLVGVREPGQDLLEHVDRARDLEAALLGEHVVEALAAHELHHDVGLRAVQPVVDDRHAVRMLELGHQHGLALEPLAAFHRGRQGRVHDLDRDRALEVQPAAAIHDSHGALGEPLLDLVAVIEDLSAEILATHAARISAW